MSTDLLTRSATWGCATRVLVVDDNADITRATAMLLELLGHVPRVSGDGETALRIAKEFEPSVVLLDLGLPVMDGYAVARELRSLPRGAAIQIIAVSGWGDAASRERSAAAGVDEHWLKPIDGEEILRFFGRART